MKSHAIALWMLAVLFVLGCGVQETTTLSDLHEAVVSPSVRTANIKSFSPLTDTTSPLATTRSEVVGKVATIINGRVVGVTDGDTVTVLDATNAQHKIRLEGIDAPESHQAFGTQSKQALSAKVFGHDVRVEWTAKDKYRRTLGQIYVDDRWINKEMVQEGWAWHYRQYSNDEDLAKAETSAKAIEAGLWQDHHAIAPWDFRHNPALADSSATTQPSAVETSNPTQSTPDKLTVYVTRTRSKYHCDGCRYLNKSKIPISHKDAKQRYSACSVCNPPR